MRFTVLGNLKGHLNGTITAKNNINLPVRPKRMQRFWAGLSSFTFSEKNQKQLEPHVSLTRKSSTASEARSEFFIENMLEDTREVRLKCNILLFCPKKE